MRPWFVVNLDPLFVKDAKFGLFYLVISLKLCC